MSAGPRCEQPETLGAVVHHEGRTYMLALVRTFWLDEGTTILEALAIDGTDSVAVEPGTWHLHRADEGPAILDVDVAVPEDLTGNHDVLLGALLDELVRKGGGWGIDARERLSTERSS